MGVNTAVSKRGEYGGINDGIKRGEYGGINGGEYGGINGIINPKKSVLDRRI